MAIYRQLWISLFILSVDFYHGYNAQEPTTYINVTEHPGAACNRICIAGQRRACYFEFYLENYQSMGVACGDCERGVAADCERPQCILGDGVQKGVMSINRLVPGPALQVCKDDLVIVDIVNQASGSAAAIHWHGMHMRATPHMDGVPYVTQCPIPFSTTFRYEFTATQSGTHWYHSHAGHHKVNGQYGALIVREPVENIVNSYAYDYDLPEHYILISDWMHEYGESMFPGLPKGGIEPSSVLINGRGSYTNPTTNVRTSVPPTRYNVVAGKRYRFRLINAGSHACPFQLQVQGHDLTVIASDGFEVEANSFDTIVNNAGERYDFVINANHTDGDFWIRVRGLGVCAFKPIETVALLRYVSFDDDGGRALPQPPQYQEQYAAGVVLNTPNAVCFYDPAAHCVSELRAIDLDEDLRLSEPDQKFVLAFNNYAVPKDEIFKPGQYRHFTNIQSGQIFAGAISNLSFVFPSYPPLTQPQDMDDSHFCDDSKWPEHCRGNERLCPCTHRLKVKLGNIVELIIVDESEAVGIMHHPFHVHGVQLMVTGMGQHPLGIPMTVESAIELEQRRILPSSSFNEKPPFKDTVSIPSRGFVVFRFRADNPGFWLMHCHYEWHLAIGMGLILQVGTPEEMVAAPVGFPTCGNYQPGVKRSSF